MNIFSHLKLRIKRANQEKTNTVDNPISNQEIKAENF
ncbi:unnamed protein product [Paramecium octaurelia]|uniref:Uncharacterized protein n=1 Tax=Paramecium octaurelia TaxID=43137 RepID=A0A8S1TKR9_PAROT|nr:unnamed protein product [Paramecium octaurelia]